MIKKIFRLVCIAHLITGTYAQSPQSYTSSEILLQLKKLNTVGSILYIAAHPDDENTRLLAYLANEKCLRTGYLSLTRGDGGQNLIGPEQGVELGIIRTQELLAARRIDRAEQYFTRAYDFGFSKSPEETFAKWNKDSILADVVWVIRNFRPDIIITRFAPDGSGGHGHHTASAILAEEAFDAAADPNRFPEQLKYVGVWQPRRMFHNSTARFFNPNADLSHLIRLDVGVYNSLLGKSYGEIAAESRSMHKSQGFGSAKQRGESFEYFKPVRGDTTGIKDLFQGIDFSWNRIKGGEKIGAAVTKAIKSFQPENPASLTNELTVLKKEFLQKKADVAIEFSIHEDLLNSIILNCMGFYFQATANHYGTTVDDSLKLTVSAINRSDELAAISGGSLPFTGALRDSLKTLNKNKPVDKTFPIKVKNATMAGNLFWIENPVKNNRFDYPFMFPFKNEPVATSAISIHNKNIPVETILQYKWVDPEKGELYRPLIITPPVMINLVNDVITFPDDQPKELKVIVRAGRDHVKGELKIVLNDELHAINITSLDKSYAELAELSSFNYSPLSAFFELAAKGEEKTYTFLVTPPKNESSAKIRIVATVDGSPYSKGIKEIKYDHIPVQTWFPEASVKLVKLNVKKNLRHIGYIPGAGDEVQACLSQLGYDVTTLTDDMLAKENLNRFDAIITGIRAYNTNEKLPQYKQRLMDFVAAGGNLIVQYNTNSWAGPVNSDIGPYPFKITRDRVTIEEAPVTFELPDHPVLNAPNKITGRDFEGWIQERGIYFAGETDSRFECPLSMNDPGEKPNKGSLIITKYGKGNYIYTGLVFFRELPAGVPGAYRLMVNLVELKKN